MWIWVVVAFFAGAFFGLLLAGLLAAARAGDAPPAPAGGLPGCALLVPASARGRAGWKWLSGTRVRLAGQERPTFFAVAISGKLVTTHRISEEGPG